MAHAEHPCSRAPLDSRAKRWDPATPRLKCTSEFSARENYFYEVYIVLNMTDIIDIYRLLTYIIFLTPTYYISCAALVLA